MGDRKSLFNDAAIEKIKDMTGGGGLLMFCCNLGKKPFEATPMSTQKVEDDGTIWFFSAKDSDRNKYVKDDSAVQLIVANPGSQDYLSIYGKAEVVHDLAKTKELWSKMVELWFPEGPTDPNVSLIRFEPEEGYYWDTKHNKMVSFAKMIGALIMGEEADDGVHGELKID